MITKTQFPTLYKRSKIGKPQEWTIIVEGNAYHTLAGQVGGVITKSEPTFCKGKNLGRANQTTPEEQAIAEAKSKWEKKTKTGYFQSIKDIDKKLSYFEPMLAKKYQDRKRFVEFPCLIGPKLDGLRMIATKDGLTTRNGKTFNSCPHISRILKPLFDKYPNWVLDGEIYSQDVPFEKIVSLTRKKDPTPEDLIESEKICQFWIFDGVIDDELASFETRFDTIRNSIINLCVSNEIIDTYESIRFVMNFMAYSDDDVNKYHNEFISEGFEGAMLRTIDAPYENKRSNHLLKVKNFLDDEYIIVDVIEGIGNRSGMAGNLVFDLGDGRTFGSGIKGNEDYYKELLINKHKYIGKKATVRYQNLTEDGMPRFPICVNIDPIDR